MGNFFGRSSGTFGYRTTAEEVASGHDLTGKNVIITGANAGLGFETARVLAKQGARVIVACRDENKGKQAVQELKALTGNENIEFMPLNLASLASVRDFANEFKAKNIPLHILIENAGVMNPPFSKSVDGYELQFATNHLGHFLLANLLLDELRAGKPSRLVVLSSDAHRYASTLSLDDINYEKSSYHPWMAYGRSKACNILFAREFDQRFANEGIRANALHPGVIPSTQLFNNNSYIRWILETVGRVFTKNIQQGAATSVFCAIHPSLENVGGKYFSDCQETQSSTLTQDMDLAKQLWEKSAEICDPFLPRSK